MCVIVEMHENLRKQEITRNPDGTFPKGVSGNQGGGGRPKGSVSLTTILRRRLQQEEADTIIDNLIDTALSKPESKQRLGKDGEHYYDLVDGNEVKLHQWAVDLLIERIDGKTPERHEHTEIPVDLAEFDTNDLQEFRNWLKERKSAKSE